MPQPRCPRASPSDIAAFPSRPVTLVVPNPPGGLVDTSARLLGDTLTKVIAQPVVIDNRAGGSGNVAYGLVARAPADGYTLLTSYSAYHVGNPSLMAKLPWAQKDFTPVALITVATNVIAVHPSIPANNLKEFIAYLKKNPGKVSYASQGSGSVSHIGTEVFKAQTGTSMVHIPYRGSGPAVQDVVTGQVQMFMTTPPSVMQFVQQGKLKAYAVTGTTRHPQLPDVPTTAEAGLPGFELESWVAIFAPAGTPPAVVAKLSDSHQAGAGHARSEGPGRRGGHRDPLSAAVAARCDGDARDGLLGQDDQGAGNHGGLTFIAAPSGKHGWRHDVVRGVLPRSRGRTRHAASAPQPGLRSAELAEPAEWVDPSLKVVLPCPICCIHACATASGNFRSITCAAEHRPAWSSTTVWHLPGSNCGRTCCAT